MLTALLLVAVAGGIAYLVVRHANRDEELPPSTNPEPAPEPAPEAPVPVQVDEPAPKRKTRRKATDIEASTKEP
jgi:hypothetical protein